MGVVIARYYGAQDFRKLRQSVAATVVIGLVLSALVMILGHFGLYPLLRFLGTPASIIGQSYQYISMIVSCVGVTLGYNLCAGLLQMRFGDSSDSPLFSDIFSSGQYRFRPFLYYSTPSWCSISRFSNYYFSSDIFYLCCLFFNK